MPTIQSEDGEGSDRSEVDGLAHFEMPKKIGLLEHDFSIERGELTPTLKVKRRVIDKTYKVADRLAVRDAEAEVEEAAGIDDVARLTAR